MGAEKVDTLQQKHASFHTTYYDKKNGLWREEDILVQTQDDEKKEGGDKDGFNYNQGPEKV